MPSCTSPCEVAPSPKNTIVASSVLPGSSLLRPITPSNFWPIAYPMALSTWLPMTMV